MRYIINSATSRQQDYVPNRIRKLCTNQAAAVQHGHAADGALRLKIGAFLNAGIGATPIPIYQCAAADTQPVGRQLCDTPIERSRLSSRIPRTSILWYPALYGTYST